ncbi:MAG: DUF533 domain-containing protein [Gammaproteobacteria bacterium]
MFNAKFLLDALVSAGSQMTSQAGGQQGGMAGGLGGMVRQVLGQATQGLQDASSKSGLTTKATEVVGQVSGGKTPQDLLAQAKSMMGQNQMATGAALGGLGALVFGTSTGRSVAVSAAQLGGLALIGGLAYKAYQNYSAGKTIISVDQAMLPAPAGSGFEADIASNETAVLFIRAMIAAAAADGHIDATERNAIIGGLKEAGFDAEANTWLENEMMNSASINDLVKGATTAELAAQVYTAARLAINPDTRAEQDFLAGLSGALGLDAELVANIDAAAASAKV